MYSRILTILAVLGLFMQAVLGAVSPAAVLCISHHDHQTAAERHAVPDGGCHGSAAAGGASACCAIQKRHVHSDGALAQADERLPIALTSPCADGCGMCVDVPLPQHDMLATSSEQLDLQKVVTLVDAIVGDAIVHFPPALRVLPWGTGPPEIQRSPDAAIIRTTRLLI